VPEAKIEDVLKRVRLNVRRKSEGQQIPWESTSLEDDFYFLPPQHVKKLSEAEIDKQFNEELAVWEKIKDAKEPAAIEDYLRKNPSGRFSELAQYQLDRVLANLGEKKIQLVVEKDNPFTKGHARIDTQFKLPMYLPSEVIYRCQREPTQLLISLSSAKGDRMHLAMQVKQL